MSIFQRLYARAQANYANSFGNHNLSATGVVEVEQYTS